MSELEILSRHSNEIGLVISLLNLLIIIYIFVGTKKHEFNLRKYEKQSVQFRELLLSDQKQDIEEFYSDLEKNADKFLTHIDSLIDKDQELVKKKSIRYYADRCRYFRKLFADQVYAFDKKLGLELYNKIDEIDDHMSFFFDNIGNDDFKYNDEDLKKFIRENRISFYHTLHLYEPFDLSSEKKIDIEDPLVLVFLLFTFLFLVLLFI